MPSEAIPKSIDKYLEKIKAAYQNEDLLVQASKNLRENIFVAHSLESTVLTLQNPTFVPPRHSIEVDGQCFLLAQEEALKSLRQRKNLTVLEGFSNRFFEYNGTVLNCFPALVDHVLRGGRPGTFPFLQDALPHSDIEMSMAYAEIEQFRQVYKPASPDRLSVFRRLNPYAPVDAYWSQGWFSKKEVEEPLQGFPTPTAIEASEVTMMYSTETGAKITDGATDNIGLSKSGVITLEKAILVVKGIRNTIEYRHLEGKSQGNNLSNRELACLMHHVIISGQATLQLSVYGIIKDDSPPI
jgi:hypothetical protein